MIALYIMGTVCCLSVITPQSPDGKIKDLVLGVFLLILAEMWRYFLP